MAEHYGIYSRVFCDFGNEFTIVDPDGDAPEDYIIKDISCGENGVITLSENSKSKISDGDTILVKEVIEDASDPTKLLSFNNTSFTVKKID